MPRQASVKQKDIAIGVRFLAGIQLQMLAIGGGIEISTGPHAGRLVVQGYAVKCFHNAAGTCNRSAVADHHPMNGFAGI